MILPKAIATAEKILKGKMSKNAHRLGRKLAPHHRVTLKRLTQEHRTPTPVS
jgi:hypothetical protein